MIIIKQLIIYIYIRLIRLLLPINDKLIIFKSTPDFADNSRALVEYLIENGYSNKYTICYIVKEPSFFRSKYNDLPIVFFSPQNDHGFQVLKNLKLLYTAKYLLSTHEMILPIEKKRKGQFLIRLWHGCGYKDRSNNDNIKKRKFDLALVPGKIFVKTKAYFWNVDEQYIMTKGYPRFDWLLKKEPKAKLLLNSIMAKDSTKMIIWMPTFRKDKNGKYNDTNHISDFPIVHSTKDWERLDKICCENHISLFIKLHPFQDEYCIPYNKLKNIKCLASEILDKNDIPLYKIIALSDALISDYSSVAIDYLLVDHPIAYTLDDFNMYKKSRGFVFEDPLKYMPGHHLFNFSDLVSFIRDVANNKDIYVYNRSKIREVAITSSTHYCLDILDALNIKK